MRCHIHGTHDLSGSEGEALTQAFIDLAEGGQEPPPHTCPLKFIGK